MVAVAAAAALLGYAGSAAAGTSSPALAPGDAAATTAYLQDISTYTQSLIANAPASLAAVEAFAGKLGNECPGVLKGAPSAFEVSSPTALKDTRTRLRQREDLKEELISAIATVYLQANVDTSKQLATSLSTLQWGNPTLTQGVHAYAAEEQERLETQAPNVCADMLAWASSDYRTLPAGTTEFEAHLKAQRTRAESEGPHAPIELLLVPYESPRDKALARRLENLELKFFKSELADLEKAATHAEKALGVQSPPGEALERSEHAVVIARGTTAAGERYVAKAEKAGPDEPHCKLTVSIERRSTTKTSPFGSIFSLGNSECLSSRYAASQASVNCEVGMLTITADTPAAAYTTRLLLSNGRVITSRVIRAPRLGGRHGYYYQVIRGPSPIPTSLTELGASGRVLRVVSLPRVIECTKHPIKYLPGDAPRALAHGRAPHGPRFTLVGERYSFLGHVKFELKLDTRDEPGEDSRGGIGSSSGSFTVGGAPSPFSIRETAGCTPHLYDIVYGILTAPGAKVLVRIDGVLRTLHEVRIPARLRAGGTLAYGAFAAAPTQVVVRGAGGRTLSSESMKGSARSTEAMCEGDEEGEGEAGAV